MTPFFAARCRASAIPLCETIDDASVSPGFGSRTHTIMVIALARVSPIEASLDNNVLKADLDGRGRSIKDDAEYLWDVDEADRFAKLALRYPHLLSHEEQVRWKVIRECGFLWRGKYGPPPSHEWQWQIAENSFCFDRLRDNWDLFCAVANGDKPASDLPTWAKSKRPPPPSSGPPPDDFDDDIPF